MKCQTCGLTHEGGHIGMCVEALNIDNKRLREEVKLWREKARLRDEALAENAAMNVLLDKVSDYSGSPSCCDNCEKVWEEVKRVRPSLPARSSALLRVLEAAKEWRDAKDAAEKANDIDDGEAWSKEVNRTMLRLQTARGSLAEALCAYEDGK